MVKKILVVIAGFIFLPMIATRVLDALHFTNINTVPKSTSPHDDRRLTPAQDRAECQKIWGETWSDYNSVINRGHSKENALTVLYAGAKLYNDVCPAYGRITQQDLADFLAGRAVHLRIK